MSHYYFDLRRGAGSDKLTVDPEGEEVADVNLRAHAVQVAREVMRTRSHVVRDWFTCTFEIRDDDHKLVAVVPFSETLEEAP